MDLISNIVGRKLASVEKILGPAEKKEFIDDEKGSKWEKVYFLHETVTIIFIGGVADWIKVLNQATVKEASLVEAFIQTMELDLNKPTYVYNQEVVRYYNIHGLKEVTFFKNTDDQISYVYIKAFSEWM